MEENLSRNSIDFVFDTSAFLSLESVNLLESVLNIFSIATTPSVIEELKEFAHHDDVLGNIAGKVLQRVSGSKAPGFSPQLLFQNAQSLRKLWHKKDIVFL